MDKFYCIECGEVEVDEEDEMCDDCAADYEEDDCGDNEGEDED